MLPQQRASLVMTLFVTTAFIPFTFWYVVCHWPVHHNLRFTCPRLGAIASHMTSGTSANKDRRVEAQVEVLRLLQLVFVTRELSFYRIGIALTRRQCTRYRYQCLCSSSSTTNAWWLWSLMSCSNQRDKHAVGVEFTSDLVSCPDASHPLGTANHQYILFPWSPDLCLQVHKHSMP
jgi:hypothetical protein